MPRQRLIATALLAISAFPLMLIAGQLGTFTPLASVAIPLTAVIAYTVICVAARTRPVADERALGWLVDLHPALGVAATGCAMVCWLALQAGLYGLAGTILFEMLPVPGYPVALIGLFAVVTLAGWWPWRSGGWRIGWLVWPGLIATWLLTVGYGAAGASPSDWTSPTMWLAAAAATLVAVAVLGGTLSGCDGHTDVGRQALARAATTAGSVALAACLGYAVFDMCSRLGSGPLGGPPTDWPPGTAVRPGPAGFTLAEPLMRTTLAFAPTTGPALRWLILAAVLVAAVLFARAGTDQIDALRRAFTARSTANAHPSLTARIVHTALAAVLAAGAATGYPVVLAYAGLAIGSLGLTLVAGFGVLGHLWGWGEQSTEPIPAPAWAALTVVAPIATWWIAASRLPVILAWPWSDYRTWILTAVYPVAGLGTAAAAGWLRWRRRDTYAAICVTLLGPDRYEHEALPSRGHRGWQLPDKHTVHVGDRIWLTLSDGQTTTGVIVAADHTLRPIVCLPGGGTIVLSLDAIRVPSRVPA